MKNRDKTTYILINLILLVLALLLTLFVVIQYKNNKTDIVSSLGEQANIIISSVQVEDNNKNKTENQQTIVPIQINSNTISNNSENKYYKYYYNQLDENAKKIYSAIENNADNMKTGTYTINLPDEVANILSEQNGQETLNTEFQSAWDAIAMDRVDLFYVDISKIMLKIKTVTKGKKVEYYLSMGPNDSGNYLEEGFQNEQVVNMALGQVNNEREKIVSNMKGSEYNKILQAHDWIVENVEYGTNKSGQNAYNIYGTFAAKSVVCEGYAEAFKYIMDAESIPCVLISGTAQNSEGTTENHEWNYVQLDGKWYAIDVTWDDPIIQGGGYLTNSLKYKYFLKGLNTINKNHFLNGKVSVNGITFTYPNLEKNDY